MFRLSQSYQLVYAYVLYYSPLVHSVNKFYSRDLVSIILQKKFDLPSLVQFILIGRYC